jgi:HAD superfamily hydrolase (TIGR01549 family)
MSRISAVLFDVDGTLVDTNYLHTVTWWEAFRQYGHHVPMAHIHRSIGMGSEALYAPYWPRLRAFDGAAGLLRACADRGLRVVLASSAGEREMRALRNALDAEDVVVTATSAGDAEESKPAPDILEIALERNEATPDAAILAGDTVWDVQACRKPGSSPSRSSPVESAARNCARRVRWRCTRAPPSYSNLSRTASSLGELMLDLWWEPKESRIDRT